MDGGSRRTAVRGDMGRYLVRRLVYAVLTFFGITVVTFALIHSVPGDPITFYIGRAGSHSIPAAILDNIRREYHLDQPLPLQYVHWVRGVVTLDFGRSIVERRGVGELVFEKLPNTLQLNTMALLIAAAIGIPIGLWSAQRSGRPIERASAVLF